MNELIQAYEILRLLADELREKLDLIDERLVKIELRLPDDYQYPGDPPLNSEFLP